MEAEVEDEAEDRSRANVGRVECVGLGEGEDRDCERGWPDQLLALAERRQELASDDKEGRRKLDIMPPWLSRDDALYGRPLALLSPRTRWPL